MDQPDPFSRAEAPEASEQDSSEQDGAEAAFEALCAEVTALRRAIELLHRQGKEARQTGPDYSRLWAGWSRRCKRRPRGCRQSSARRC